MNSTKNTTTQRDVSEKHLYQIYQKSNKPLSILGFTLVELIVVITILVILGTIAFLNLGSFSGSARDSARISNLTNLKKGLDLFQIRSGTYPMPEGSVAITASGVTIGNQGFAKEQIESLVKLSPGATKDPVDPTMYPTYTVNLKQDKMQALVFLEDSSTVTAFVPLSSEGEVPWRLPKAVLSGAVGVRQWGGDELIPTTFASTSSDYSKRFPATIGDSLGILISSTGSDKGKPAQEIQNIITSGSLDIRRTSDEYKALFSASDFIVGTGTQLQSLQISYVNGAGLNSPSSCPPGFLPVPGNKEFNQPGFCVAKYEMSYSDADVPTSSMGGTGWNTVASIPGKVPVSMIGKYPIADITQSGAIASCQSMGAGYHLITNNEWMTLARNIEAQNSNWSNRITGSGYISNGVSNDATLGCGTSASGTQAQYPLLTRAWATKTGEGFGNTSCDTKRQLKLSNGQVIWDLAGNVWEHVNKANTMDGSDYGTGWVNLDPSDTDWHNTGWTASVFDPYRKLYGPSNSTYTHTTNGIGNVYGVGGTTLTTGNIFLRGGGADSSTNVGVFTLILNWASAVVGRNVGFRCTW
ncbi:MAG: type II secretion system protein [Candidatus Gracilibacteria bacterium]|nr:type II secretion system protein [Candidatus Gracilibacteria bacterium]